MKKIAIVRFADQYGGIEHQITNIVSNINNRNFEFILITNNISSFSREFEKYGKVYIIASTNLFKATEEVKKIIKMESIDILQSHMLREHYICCLAKCSFKNIYHIFRVHTYINCSYISNLKKKLYHILARLLSKNVNLYLVINNANYNELINKTKIKKDKIKVLHNGARSVESAISNKEFNYYDIVMISNLVYGKGYDIALKALEKLVKSDNKYNITFIGATNAKNKEGKLIIDEIKELAVKLDVIENIKFVGFKEDITDEIKDKNIIILPSNSEGTPNCLLEAMSAKKIVVASAVGGIPEFIENGKNGFLHKNKDYEQLGNLILNIKNLKSDELQEIVQNGYNTWKNQYSIAKLCNELTKIYEEVN